MCEVNPPLRTFRALARHPHGYETVRLTAGMTISAIGPIGLLLGGAQ